MPGPATRCGCCCRWPSATSAGRCSTPGWARTKQPARGGGAAARGRPLLPPAHLCGGAAALPGADRLRRLGRHAGPAAVGLPGAGLRGRHDLGPGHQHRPRAGPQAHGARSLAGQAGAGGAGLRPLPRRAQPRPPRVGGHARGPCQRAHGRKHLPLRAARAARRHAPRLGAGERTPAPRRPQRLEPAQRTAAELRRHAGAAGHADRAVRLEDGGLPGHPQPRRLVAADQRQLRRALRPAAR